METSAPGKATRLEFTWRWDRGEYVRAYRAVQRHASTAWLIRAIGWGVAALAAFGTLAVAYAFAVGEIADAL